MKMLENLIESASRKLRVPIFASAMIVSSLGIFQGCEKPQQPETPVVIQEPSRLKDYGKLYFISQSIESAPDSDINFRPTLWTCKSDGSGLKKLMQNLKLKSNTTIGNLEISPDYKNIAFVKEGKHVIMDTTGVVIGEFASGPFSSTNFSWTPDSKSILYAIYFDGIFRYDIESKNTTRLYQTYGRIYDHEPVMSPITQKIAFVHHTSGHNANIYTMNNKGDSVEVVSDTIQTSHDAQICLTWLDKSHLYFTNNLSLYYLNVDTKENIEIKLGSAYGYPLLSPDKKTIVMGGGRSNLYFFNTDELASGAINCRKSKYPVFFYNWSPDSKYVVTSYYDIGRIIDMKDNEYTFLKKEDFPVSMTFLPKIVWTF